MKTLFIRLIALSTLLLASGGSTTARAGAILWGPVDYAWAQLVTIADGPGDPNDDIGFHEGLGSYEHTTISTYGAYAHASAVIDPRTVGVNSFGRVPADPGQWGHAYAMALGEVRGEFRVDEDGPAYLPVSLQGIFVPPEESLAYGSTWGELQVAIIEGDSDVIYSYAAEYANEDGSFDLERSVDFADFAASATYRYWIRALVSVDVTTRWREDRSALLSQAWTRSYLRARIGDSLPPVPEPGPGALLGLGIAAMLIIAFRRNGMLARRSSGLRRIR